jgi:acetyl esterase/lipase
MDQREPVGRGFAVAAACALAVTLLAACLSAGSAPPAATSRIATVPTAPALAAGQVATVRYCNHARARIIEPATLHGPAPAAVYVHGGSWVSGNYDTGGFISNSVGPALSAKGFVVVGLDYRLGPTERWPDQIVDVKCAIRYLRANAPQLNIDPGEIGAWGQSAGGHLVGLLGTAGPSAGWDVGPYPGVSSGVQAVVDMAGPSDLLTMGNRGDAVLVSESFASLLGRVPRDQLGADLKAASPVTYVAPGDPPFLIVDANNDEIVYPQQSRELSWDLGANGVPHRLVQVSQGGHQFDAAGESPSEKAIIGLVVDFFVRTLAFHQPFTSN